MKIHVFAFSEDYDIPISFFTDLDAARIHYIQQVCADAEFERCAEILHQQSLGNIDRAYDMAKERFSERENSTVDNMVLKTMEVPVDGYAPGTHVEVMTDTMGWRVARITKRIVMETQSKTLVRHSATITGKCPNHMRKWSQPDQDPEQWIRPRTAT